MKDELIGYDGIELGNLIRKGEITPLELLEITIERIERVNPRLNAVIHKLYDQARAEAKQWSDKIKNKKTNGTVFAGVPFLLKNLSGRISKERLLTKDPGPSKAMSPNWIPNWSAASGPGD